MRNLRVFLCSSFLLVGCGAMQPMTPAPEPSIAQGWVKALNECQVDALVALYDSCSGRRPHARSPRSPKTFAGTSTPPASW